MTITDTPDAPTAPTDAATPEVEEAVSPSADAPAQAGAPTADGTAPELPEATTAEAEDAGAELPEAATADAEGTASELPEAPTAEAEGPAAALPEAATADAEGPGAALPEAATAPADESDDPADAAADREPAATDKKRAPKRAAKGESSRRTTAQRLGNFPRADRPAEIPAPDHHHLPGWVRRDFARARPPLSNILALLEGDAREQFAAKIDELTKGISAGRFSLAWQYPDLVDEGRTLYESQRRENAESARANRQLDTARRRVQDRIRDVADQLTPEVSARLQRQLRSAADAESINAVAQELDGVSTAAKSTAEKRREREIERTRARIRRTAAGTATTAEAAPQTETWQDVLRRFAEQQAAGSRGSE